MDEDYDFDCEACGDKCPGSSECNQCSATLCGNCESEYADCCRLCYRDEPEE